MAKKPAKKADRFTIHAAAVMMHAMDAVTKYTADQVRKTVLGLAQSLNKKASLDTTLEVVVRLDMIEKVNQKFFTQTTGLNPNRFKDTDTVGEVSMATGDKLDEQGRII